MCDQGHTLTFYSIECEIRKEGLCKLVTISRRTLNNIYILDRVKEKNYFFTKIDEGWIWHRRMGHVHFKNLIKVRKEHAIRNMHELRKPLNSNCKHCQLGKKTKVEFNTKEYSTTNTLVLIHINLCRTMRTKGINGEVCFILFIDEYSRMIWVSFLNKKYEAFETLKVFKKEVENETKLKVKCLRSNNDGEFTSK